MTGREDLGRLVRETWVAWAREQRDPKLSWLVPWEELDDGQREVDMRIGEAVAAAESVRWRSALQDALEGMLDMLPYAPEYFRDKWDLEAYVERAKTALERT